MKIFDTHNHIWKCEGKHFSWITEDLAAIKRDFTMDDLEKVLTENNIEKGVLVQAVPEIWETEQLLSQAETSSHIAGVIGWVDVAQGDAITQDLIDLKQAYSKLRGIRYMSQGLPPEHLIEPKFVEGVKRVGKEGLIYELLITASQLRHATELVSLCPKVTFVVEHIAKPSIKNSQHEQWSDNLYALGLHSNVYCKLSGMVTEADLEHWQPADITPYMNSVLNAFGDQRVMYGSDYPVCLLAATYQDVLALVVDWLAKHPDISAEKILSSNAEALYLKQS